MSKKENDRVTGLVSLSNCEQYNVLENLSRTCLSPLGSIFSLSLYGGSLDNTCQSGETNYTPVLSCSAGFDLDVISNTCIANQSKKLYRLGEHVGGPNGEVNSIIVQPDNKIIIGGTFTTYDGVPRNKIARLNADYSLDPSFLIKEGFEGYYQVVSVKTMVLQPDGKILVGGLFDSYNKKSAKSLIRLNADGTPDTGFNISQIDYNLVSAIALQANDKIIINTKLFNGPNYSNNLSRLNPDGHLDSSFNRSTASTLGTNGPIHKILVQTDGKILLVGKFTKYNNKIFNNIVRLLDSGLEDTSFRSDGLSDGEITDVGILPSNEIIISGKFSIHNGTQAYRLAKLNYSGQAIKALSSTNLGFLQYSQYIDDFYIANFIIHGNEIITTTMNKSYVVGEMEQNGILKFSSNLDLSDSLTNSSYFEGTPYSLALDNNSDILVGGNISNNYSYYFLKIKQEGKILTPKPNYSEGIQGSISSWIQLPDENLLLAVEESYLKPAKDKILKLDPNNNLSNYLNLTLPLEERLQSHRYSINLSESNIVLGGRFTGLFREDFNPNFFLNIVKLNIDGSFNTEFNHADDYHFLIDFIFKIKILSDGKILVLARMCKWIGRELTFYTALIKLDKNGSKDLNFNEVVLEDINSNGNYTFEVQDDGKILIGGAFQSFNGNAANGIFRINSNGEFDHSFYSDLPFLYVKNIKVLSNGKILLFGNKNGSFTIGRINKDGNFDSSFLYSLSSTVSNLSIDHSNKIILITEESYLTSPRIIRLNENGTRDTSFFPTNDFKFLNISGKLSNIISLKNGNYIVLGKFSKYGHLYFDNILILQSSGLIEDLP